MARDPFCSNCGYSLKGLTESSKCPECGRPLVEVLERGPLIGLGRRYTSDIVIFGLPLVQIALGPYEEEKYGRARGIIAIGDRATGWLAVGSFARGIIACGGVSIGLVAVGGLGLGGISIGGVALGLIAYGGLVGGGIGVGGLVVAYVAVSAGLGVAYYARAGFAHAVHGLGNNVIDPVASTFFKENAWLFGRTSTGFTFMSWVGLAIFMIAVIVFLVVLCGYLARAARDGADHSRMR